MATGEGTGVQSGAGNVCITMLEAGRPSSSHSNRGSQIESAPQKRACRNSWIEWMMIHIDVVVCVLFLGGLIASLISQGLKNHEIWGLELWKWCVLALVIVGGRRIMKWMEHCVVCLIRKIFFLLKCKVRYSYYIYGLGKYVRIFLWFGLVLLTCYLLFESSKVKKSKLDSNVQKYIMRSLATCVIGGFLWVLKTLLVNILTPPFQATRLFDRFRESLIDQYILEVMFPKNIYFHEVCTKESNEVLKWVKNNRLPTKESGKVIKWLKQMESEEIPAWSMKELMTVIRSPRLSSITDKLEQLAKKEPDMTKLFKETKVIANQIFESIEDGKKTKDNGLHTIFKGEVGDVVQHIKGTGAEGIENADQKEEGKGREIAEQKEEGEGKEIAEQKEEGDGIEIAEQKEEGEGKEIANQKEKGEGIEIGMQALRKWLVNAVVERRSLAQSLEDAERAKAELNRVVSGTVLILVFIIWLIMLGILTTGALVVLITQFAALTFIFGDTCKSVFQGIVFVFVMHPFDVDDCCLLNKEEVVVERINLLSTIFRENMKDKIVYPNSVLTGMQIKNLDKGDRHIIRDSFEITIGPSTDCTSKTIENMIASEIRRFLNRNKNKWSREHYLTWKGIENEKLKLILSVSYRKTELVSDWEVLNSRRKDLLQTLLNLFNKKNITCCSILPKTVNAE